MRRKTVLGIGVLVAAAVIGITLPRALSQGLEISGGGSVGDPVSIIGPQSIVKAIENCRFGSSWFGKGGNGLSVDWGDGSQIFSGLKEGESCSERQGDHVYSVPGEYTVRVRKWHPGPTDAPITDWLDEATVTIIGAPVSDSLVMEEIEGGEFRYQASVPVKWTASASRNSSIVIEALTADGTLISRSRERPWSMVGPGEARLSLNSRDYDRALQSGEGTFFVRTSLLRDGEVVASDASGPLKMTARHHESMEESLLKWAKSKGQRTVSIGINTYHPDCLSYRIEWGDGQATEEITPIRKFCDLDSQTVEVKHTYDEPGAYKVRFWTNGYRPFEPLENNVSFTEAEIVVVD